MFKHYVLDNKYRNSNDDTEMIYGWAINYVLAKFRIVRPPSTPSEIWRKMSSVAVPISRVTPRSDASQSGSLVVGYELVVGCDNPMDRGADLRET